MFRWIRKSVKNKILLTVMVILIISGLIMTYTTYSLTTDTLVSQKKEALKESTVSEALNISQKLDQAQVMIKTMADDPCTSLYLTGQPITMDINDSLDVHLVDGFLTDVGIVRLDGTVAADTNKGLVGKNYKDETFFKRALTGERSVVQAIDIPNKAIKYYVFSPAKMKGGNIVGVVFANVQPDVLYSGLTATTLHDVGDLMVVDSDGMVIYSTDNKDTYKSLWTLFGTEKEDIGTKYKTKNVKIESMQYEAAKDKIKNFRGATIFDFNCIEDKSEPEMMAISNVGLYPFYLATEFETEKVTNVAINNAAILAGIGVVILVVTIFTISYLITRLLKPIKSLRGIIDSISRGNLDQDVNIKSGDEFENLGNAIDTMTSRLKEKEVINEIRNKKSRDK